MSEDRSPMRIARRAFLAGLLAAFVLPPLYATFWWRRHARERDVIPIVRAIATRTARGMNVTEATIDRFAADYAGELPASWRRLAAWAGAAAPLPWLLTAFRAAPRFGDQLRLLEDTVATAFLLSTDFYQGGADRRREVAYLGLYDPLKRPCIGMFLRGD